MSGAVRGGAAESAGPREEPYAGSGWGRTVAGVPEELPVEQALAERVRAQCLGGGRPADAVEAVRRVGSLQAQDPRAVRLAVWTRTEGLDAAAVDGAFGAGLVVTWLMRGTLHVVPAEDVRWLLDLLRPPRSAGRTRRLGLGLDDGVLDRALPAVAEALADGPLTRAELADRVRAGGHPIGPGQAPAHLVGVAAREGLVCRGPDRDGESTYVRLDDLVPPSEPVDRDVALARLARRYLAGHGPATGADLATWSGLPLRDARAGLAANDLEEVLLAGTPAHRLPAGTARPADRRTRKGLRPAAGSENASAERTGEAVVRLVPAFDEYVLGYRGRELALDPAYAARIQAGGGIIHPAVLVGGRIVGRWAQQRGRDRLWVSVEPFGRLPRGTRAGLEAEVADLGRFLGLDAALRPLGHGEPA